MIFNWLKRRRRERILKREMPSRWLDDLQRNFDVFLRLPQHHRSKLIDTLRIIVAEQTFEGCDGLVITDEIKVTISAQAALLLLGTDDYFFETVSSILVFPDAIEREVTRFDSGHPVHGSIQVNAGEAYPTGQIALSWPDVLMGGQRADGHNVVIHEFAHHLDGLDGEMGGFIPFTNSDDAKRWEEVSQREFEALIQARDSRSPSVLDTLNYYGATNRAEFFAVASETFYENPTSLHQFHAELFDLLYRFYRVDPREWEWS